MLNISIIPKIGNSISNFVQYDMFAVIDFNYFKSKQYIKKINIQYQQNS